MLLEFLQSVMTWGLRSQQISKGGWLLLAAVQLSTIVCISADIRSASLDLTHWCVFDDIWATVRIRSLIANCQPVEWWHTFHMCSGRLCQRFDSILACEEKEQGEAWLKWAASCKLQGWWGSKPALNWPGPALCVAGWEPCKAVISSGNVQCADWGLYFKLMTKILSLIWIWTSSFVKCWAEHGGSQL